MSRAHGLSACAGSIPWATSMTRCSRLWISFTPGVLSPRLQWKASMMWPSVAEVVTSAWITCRSIFLISSSTSFSRNCRPRPHTPTMREPSASISRMATQGLWTHSYGSCRGRCCPLPPPWGPGAPFMPSNTAQNMELGAPHLGPSGAGGSPRWPPLPGRWAAAAAASMYAMAASRMSVRSALGSSPPSSRRRSIRALMRLRRHCSRSFWVIPAVGCRSLLPLGRWFEPRIAVYMNSGLKSCATWGRPTASTLGNLLLGGSSLPWAPAAPALEAAAGLPRLTPPGLWPSAPASRGGEACGAGSRSSSGKGSSSKGPSRAPASSRLSSGRGGASGPSSSSAGSRMAAAQ
mmetsp:Transcript_2732/g.7536  ORF Transcript_2732/g.7536 Transcript_2732/m.7536 type:complete len:348 (-) Transcript_2732:56-1099(-)